MTVDDLRERAECDLVAVDHLTEMWVERYQEISEGYIDPSEYDIRYLQVAKIGDAAMSEIEADRIPDRD